MSTDMDEYYADPWDARIRDAMRADEDDYYASRGREGS